MKMMGRNKRVFYYANPTGSEMMLDEQGYENGTLKIVYEDKKRMALNVGPNTTTTNVKVDRTMYGNDESYERIMFVPKNFPFTEETVFWLDNLDADKPDYFVVGITNLLNLDIYTLRKINAS